MSQCAGQDNDDPNGDRLRISYLGLQGTPTPSEIDLFKYINLFKGFRNFISDSIDLAREAMRRATSKSIRDYQYGRIEAFEELENYIKMRKTYSNKGKKKKVRSN